MQSMIMRGSTNLEDAERLWQYLGKVYFEPSNEPDRGDAWAVLLEDRVAKLLDEINGNQGDRFATKKLPKPSPTSATVTFNTVNFPARSFTRDLEAILDLQNQLTRRQWVSLLDCFLRLATVSDFLWTCKMGSGLAQVV